MPRSRPASPCWISATFTARDKRLTAAGALASGCNENPLWGALRIRGELLKLGFELAESTVSKYMIRRRGPPSQTRRAFLRNHADAIAAIGRIFLLAYVRDGLVNLVS